MERQPRIAALLLMIVSSALFLGLAVWSWGSWNSFFAHPARTGAVLVVILTTLAAVCSGNNLSGGKSEAPPSRWVWAPVALVGLMAAWLPAFTDQHDMAALDGDFTRYLGLALLLIGCILRVGPMFALERRFSWWLTIQEGHRLVTTGFYRFIRHPSYLGALLGGIGWVLVFRSVVGLLLILLVVPMFLAIMRQEEALLLSEFGEEYADYRRRSWRLLPFLY